MLKAFPYSIAGLVYDSRLQTGRFLSHFRTEKLTDFLESYIDPFDLDVFTPHLNSNLNRLVQRTSVSSKEEYSHNRIYVWLL